MEDYLKAHDRLGQLLGKDIVFVVGATRWGTSWVQQCLDTHPNICCKGEGHFTDGLFPSLAKLIDQYNQDAEKIGNRMQLAGLPGNAAGFTFDDVEHLMRTAMALMFQRWIGDQEDITCIGEKTPEHVLSLELLDKLFPEMRIVHVVRDGRDEAASAWDFNMGISRGEFPRRYPSFADFAETFARNWSRSVGSARRFGRLNRRRYYQIRAEDVVEEPAPIIRRLFRFCSVDDREEDVQAAIKRAYQVAPLDIDPGVWHRRFDKDATRRFHRQSGELLKLLNYQVQEQQA
jgi:hypothetical protein